MDMRGKKVTQKRGQEKKRLTIERKNRYNFLKEFIGPLMTMPIFKPQTPKQAGLSKKS
jgi:hypothetical protein